MSSTDSQQWNEYFNKAAAEYLKQSAGVTRNISQQILTLLPPFDASSVVHDNAAGPGVVSFDILAQATKNGTQFPTIHATDFSPGMVAQIQTVIDEKNLSTVTAQVMDGSDLSPFKDDMFTHSITNFGIFMFSEPISGAAHILRTLKPGGTAAITVWKTAGNITFINEVRQALAPGKLEWSPLTKNWLEKAHFKGILETAGFKEENIEFVEKEAIWSIDNLEEAMELMNGRFFEPAKEGLNEEQRAKWTDVVREKLQGRNGKGIRMVAWLALARK
jgi:ubiquinone/menaquinone biosynthesis C-methylase UbiE